MLVGEMRDQETAQIGLRAAMTGHLVLSTLHTNDAASTPLRLMDMGVPRYMVGSSLQAVLAQRLVRKICESCSAPHAISFHRPSASSCAPSCRTRSTASSFSTAKAARTATAWVTGAEPASTNCWK
ncbi:Flp pilus assembly complex ATPase component TadA [Massilia sp. H-1]|nr:Flp pilus assembly complex ATPase component TadA [Massilia sp. H-1]